MIVDRHIQVSDILVPLDLGGTFVFALSGAVAGVKPGLDLFGVLVLSLAAAPKAGSHAMCSRHDYDTVCAARVRYSA